MQLSTDRIREFFPDFNLRAHDEKDFWRAAQDLKVVVQETPLIIEGYYEYKKKQHYILINSNLNHFDWLLTAFHELTHRILDVPYKKSTLLLKRDLEKIKQKQERRAEDIALMFVIPLKMLLELQDTPFEELNPSLQKYLIQRQNVYERHSE